MQPIFKKTVINSATILVFSLITHGCDGSPHKPTIKPTTQTISQPLKVAQNNTLTAPNATTSSSSSLLFNRDYSAAPEIAKNDSTVAEYYTANKLCSQPTVIEFFSYGCHGCAGADPNFQNWLKSKPKDVQFKRIPVVFNQAWDMLARIYYTNEQFGIEEQLHPELFAWFSANPRILTPDDVKAYITDALAKKPELAQKVTVENYMNVLNSNALNAKISNGMRMFTAYGLLSTPSVAINNQYTVTVNQAGTLDKLMATITELANGATNCKQTV